MKSLRTQFSLSLVLTALTLFVKAVADHLPYSQARDTFSDILDYPGILISSVFYREGIHTGHGSLLWVFVAIASTTVFYVLAWFFVIRIVIKIRSA